MNFVRSSGFTGHPVEIAGLILAALCVLGSVWVLVGEGLWDSLKGRWL